jgi:hypothetical protein
MANPLNEDTTMTHTDQLRALCASQNVGLYLSNSLRSKDEPWVIFKVRGATIAEFRDVDSALRWFPKKTVSQPGRSAHFLESRP